MKDNSINIWVPKTRSCF